MTPSSGPMLRVALVTAAVLLALPSAALAADAKPAAPKAVPAKAPAARKAPVARAPVDPGPPAAGPDQLAVADQVYYGSHECEFNQTAQVEKNSRHAGYVDVKQGKAVYLMKPVLSSTGAIRLEDVKGQTLMVQIASKSMLLDVKAGRRIVDDCVSAKHREAIERYRQAKLDEAAALAAAAASGVVAGPGSGEVRPLLSGPGAPSASTPAQSAMPAASAAGLASAVAPMTATSAAPPLPAASSASAP